MRKIFLVLSIFTVSCVLLSDTTFGFTQNKIYKITILHTNDHHGRFWKNSKDEYGMAARATLINKIRQEVQKSGGQTLYLDGGDLNTGTPESDLQDAVPDILGMNALKLDAMAIGNHEFDKPTNILYQQIKLAKFPFLAANIFKKNTQVHAFKPYIIKKIDDLKVGIIGFTTNETPMISRPENMSAFDFVSPIQAAQNILPLLDKKTDLVFAVTHMGHYDNEQPERLYPGDIQLAAQTHGIDIIVGGHTQIPLLKPTIMNGTYILQAYEWGKYLGRLDLEFVNGKKIVKKYELIPVNIKNKEELIGQYIPEDAEMLKLLRPFYEKVDVLVSQEIGRVTEAVLGRPSANDKESNGGRILTESYRSMTNSDIGILNLGALRVDWKKNIITYKDILEMMPFQNQLVTFHLTGRELYDYFAKVISPSLNCAGIKIKMRESKIDSLEVAGQKVVEDDSTTFKIVTINYLASGGAHFPVMTNVLSFQSTPFSDSEAFKQYLEKVKIIDVSKFQEPSLHY